MGFSSWPKLRLDGAGKVARSRQPRYGGAVAEALGNGREDLTGILLLLSC
jgi:hypothetical protein